MTNSILNKIDSLFSNFCKQQNNPLLSPSSSWDEKRLFDELHFQNELKNEKFCKILNLNAIKNWNEIPDGSVVKYRCFIQQPLSPELYVGAYKLYNDDLKQYEWKTTKYRERITDDINEETVLLWRRFVYKCIEVPEQTEWVQELEKENELDHNETQKLSEDFEKEVNIFCEEKNSILEINKLNGTSDFYNYCIVKVYDDKCEVHKKTKHDDGKAIKINDIVEFIGIFYNKNSSKNSTEEGNEEQLSFQNFPCIHSLIYRKLGNWNPLFELHFKEKNLTIDDIWKHGYYKKVDELRKALINWISGALYGDRYVAEYVFLSLCSSQFRSNYMKIGGFSLNIFPFYFEVKDAKQEEKTCVSFDVLQLSKKLKLLKPRLAVLNLKNELLNEVSFASQMRYFDDHEVLDKGFFQLGEGTYIIIDECGLDDEKKLSDIFKNNILTIKDILATGEVGYKFMSGIIKYDTDFSIILCSEKISKFADFVTVQFPIQKSTNPIDEIEINASMLKQFQLWIAYVSSLNISVDIPKTVSEFIENYFVEQRQNFFIESDLLSIWIKLARIYCFSFGETSLSISRWKELMEIDTIRRTRIKKYCEKKQ